MAIREDFENLNAMVQTMDTQLDVLEELTNTTITDGYGLTLDTKDLIKEMTYEYIDNLTNEEIVSSFGGEENSNIQALRNLHENNEEYKDKDFSEFVKFVFSDIKKSLDEIERVIEDKRKITKEITDLSDNYFNYVNSKEYKEKKMKRIENLREKAQNESDPIQKKKIERMLNSMESAETLQFLFDRIEKVGNKEINNIKDVFFDKNRSTLVMNKFHSRLHRYGYNEDIYKMFFNIEEKFLPEEYHDFNNIFLFHVMRYISYTDPYNKEDSLFTSSILIKLYNLLYHKFESVEMEKEFIDIIKKFDDYFVDYRDFFKEHNTTSPNHPKRIKRDKEYDERRRMMIISSLENEGIHPDTTLSTEELRSMLQDVIDKKSKELDSMKEELGDADIEVSDNNEEIFLSDFDKDANDEREEENQFLNEAGSVEKAIDIVESSPLLKELDSMAEEMGGTLIPEQKVAEPFNSIEKKMEESNGSVSGTNETLEKAIEMVESSPEIDSMENLEKECANELKHYTENEPEHVNVDVVLTEPETIDVYMDAYKCYYALKDDNSNSYTYYDENHEIIEDNVKEDDVLRLISSGAVSKVKIAVEK